MKYHYCALSGKTGHYIDGILTTAQPITDMDSYHAAKRAICEGTSFNPEWLTIVTLTPLPTAGGCPGAYRARKERP